MEKQELQIEDYGMDGVGIAHGQKTYFLPNVLLGEKVCLDENNTPKILQKSHNRVQPVCPYYTQCGGCNLQCMNNQEQQNYKTIYLKNCLKKYKIAYTKDLEYVCSDELYYRNKISFAVRKLAGKNIVGLFEAKSHNVIPIEECLIVDKRHRDVLDVFRKYLALDGVEGFSEAGGNIRNVVVRFIPGAVLVCVVGTKPKLVQAKALEALLKQSFEVFSLNYCQNNNPKTILSNKIEFVAGKSDLTITKNGLTMPINISSFLQVNDEISAQIYDYVASSIPKNSVVFDLYSGAGLMTAMLALHSAFCVGVECNPFAVQLSQQLFKQNKIENAHAILGKSEDVLPKLLKNLKSGKICFDGRTLANLKQGQQFCCVLDPPRKGCNTSLLNKILQSNVDTLVYVSCQPITLARDLKILTQNYDIQKIKLFDMFYLTSHVETVALLTKKHST